MSKGAGRGGQGRNGREEKERREMAILAQGVRGAGMDREQGTGLRRFRTEKRRSGGAEGAASREGLRALL